MHSAPSHTGAVAATTVTPASPPAVRLRLAVCGGRVSVGSACHVAPDLSVRGRVSTLVRPSGFLDPTLLAHTDLLVHTLDCTSSSPDEHTRALLRAAPHGSVYSRGRGDDMYKGYTTPGHFNVSPTSSSERLRVCTLFTQWTSGPPSAFANPQPGPSKDSAHCRLRWFKESLSRLRAHLSSAPDGTVVSFPQYVGCLSDVSAWKDYRSLILAFAGTSPHLRVLIVKRSSDSINEALQSTYSSISAASSRARSYIDDKCTDPMERALAMAVVAQLDERLKTSVESSHDAPSSAPTPRVRLQLSVSGGRVTTGLTIAPRVTASSFTDELKATVESLMVTAEDLSEDARASVERALHQQRIENDACDEDFRESLRRRLESGELTSKDLEKIARSMPQAAVHAAIVESDADLDGKRVKIHSLSTDADLNGCSGIVSEHRGARLHVRLDRPPSGYPPTVRVKPSHVMFLTTAADDPVSSSAFPSEAVAV